VSPPSLATRVRRALEDAAIPWGATLLVACSGGVDSQVLLDTLAHVATGSAQRGARVRLVAHGVDHGLRPEAAAELDLARALAGARGIPFTVTKVEVGPGGNLQARAREARLLALRGAAERAGALHICMAHHLDDRAETVLIRILRGAPLPALAVLPLVSGGLFRPLIEARRSEILAAASRRKLVYAHDPANDDRRFVRVRVRHEVMPLLRTLDPRVVEHLVGLADDAAAMSYALSYIGDDGSFPSRRRR
jgi:tRNA(Ile)-lysidine synthase